MYAYCNNNPINSFDSDGILPKWLKKLGSKIAKKATSVFKSVVSITKTIGKAVIKRVKKDFKSYRENLVIEAGIGTGLKLKGKVFNIGNSLGISQGKTWKFKNNKTSTNITGTASLDIVGAGISADYVHPSTYDNIFVHSHKNKLLFNPKDCSQSTKITSLNIPFVSISSYSMFIGVELDAHLILGGHIKLGWEIEDPFK